MRSVFLLLVLAGFVGGIFTSITNSALGRQQFKNGWDKKYVNGEPATPEDKTWADLVKKTNCNICHIGTDRKKRNEYGIEVSKRLNGRDIGNPDKIEAALEEVGKLKSDPNNPNSPTYADLIAKHQLPCETPPAQAAAAPAANP